MASGRALGASHDSTTTQVPSGSATSSALAAPACNQTCKHSLDALGDCAAACPRSGKLKVRPRPVEKMRAGVLREAGARVRKKVYPRDTTLPSIRPSDGHHIEIVATGLTLGRGVPLAADATLVSPLHMDGSPLPRAALVPGVALAAAEQQSALRTGTWPTVQCCSSSQQRSKLVAACADKQVDSWTQRRRHEHAQNPLCHRGRRRARGVHGR